MDVSINGDHHIAVYCGAIYLIDRLVAEYLFPHRHRLAAILPSCTGSEITVNCSETLRMVLSKFDTDMGLQILATFLIAAVEPVLLRSPISAR